MKKLLLLAILLNFTILLIPKASLAAECCKDPLKPYGTNQCIDPASKIVTSCNATQETTWDWSKIYSCLNKIGVDTAIGCIPVGNPANPQSTDLPNFLAFILKWVLGAAGGIIFLMLIATGYTLLTSQGNPEKLQAVKENLVSIFSGLILIGFSLVLLQTIGADILKLPTF